MWVSWELGRWGERSEEGRGRAQVYPLEAPWEWPGLWAHGQSEAQWSAWGEASECHRAQGMFPYEARIEACVGPGGSLWPLWAGPETAHGDLRSGCGALGSSAGQLEVPPSASTGLGWWRGTVWSYPTRLPRGTTGTAVTSPLSPLSPPDGLAVESDSGCVPGPAWEEGLPCAGGGPGAF